MVLKLVQGTDQWASKISLSQDSGADHDTMHSSLSSRLVSGLSPFQVLKSSSPEPWPIAEHCTHSLSTDLTMWQARMIRLCASTS